MNAFCLPVITLKRLIYICLLVVALFSVPSNQQQSQQQQQQHKEELKAQFNFLAIAKKLLLDGNADTIARNANNLIKGVPYFQASIPMRIFECIREFSLLRCTKLFVLQKFEERKSFPNTGNVTKDFLDQFFGNEDHMGSLIRGKIAGVTDKELNQRLVWNFQRFFKDRDIKLHFLPGMIVKIVPSKENKLKFSLKKKMKARSLDSTEARSTKQNDAVEENISIGDSSEPDADTKGGNGGGGPVGVASNVINKRKNKKNSSYKYTMLQMAVPIMIMPAILMGSFLPFLLPVLKMATFMSMMLNNSAFIAALIYAARTHANSQEEPQHINYGPPQGYH